MKTYQSCVASGFALSTILALILQVKPVRQVVAPLPPVEGAMALTRAGWRVSVTANSSDRRGTTYISTGNGLDGGIVLGCNGRRLHAYVESAGQEAFDTDQKRDQDVLFRFGAKGFFDQIWYIADTGDGNFAPAPVQFVRDLIAEKTVTIIYRVNGRVEPHEYQAHDLDQHLAESCPAYAYSMRHGLK